MTILAAIQGFGARRSKPKRPGFDGYLHEELSSWTYDSDSIRLLAREMIMNHGFIGTAGSSLPHIILLISHWDQATAFRLWQHHRFRPTYGVHAGSSNHGEFCY
jgi:hypothetical protein